MTELELKALPLFTKFEAIDILNNTKVRCSKDKEDEVFVFRKGSSKRGYRYTIESFLLNYEPKIPTLEEEEKKWHRRCKNIETRLEKSGLWPEFKELFHNLQLMSLEDKKALYNIYFESAGRSMPYEELIKYDNDKHNRAFEKYGTKYPFVFCLTKDGNHRIDTDYIFETSDAKTKSMYFGRENACIKDALSNALEEKKSFSRELSARFDKKLTYDVSVKYNSEKQKAWYSEEYRDCGNGHYYAAIDGSCALFLEDD